MISSIVKSRTSFVAYANMTNPICVNMDCEQSSFIICANCEIPAKGVEIQSTFFFQRVSVEPAHEDGMVEAVAVVVKADFNIKVFRREAMPEEVGKWAGLGDEFSKGVVCVLCNRIAVPFNVARDVADVVVERNIDRAINRKVEQPSDPASALQRAGDVFAPIVADRRRRAVRVGDALFYEIPVIVEEGCRR